MAKWRDYILSVKIASYLAGRVAVPHYISNSMGLFIRLPGYAGPVGMAPSKNLRPQRDRGAELRGS